MQQSVQQDRKFRLLIAASHPVVYWLPLYRALVREPWLEFVVVYGDVSNVLGWAKSWGREGFVWSENLLQGYPFRVLRNLALSPNASTRFGKINPGLAGFWARYRPDAVLVSGYAHLYHWLVFGLAKRYGTRIFYVADTNILGDRTTGWRGRVRQRILKQLYRNIDVFLYVGTRNRAHYEAHGVPAHKLVRFALAVDNEHFASRSDVLRKQRDRLRRDWRLPEDKMIVALVARLEPWKRVDLVIRAVANVEGVHAFIVGAGAEETRLRALADDVARGRVTFAGFLNTDRIVEAYAVADLLALPSAQEAWGLVCNEALASGIPVIASNQVGAAVDLIDDGRTGWVFRSGDLRDLIRVLRIARRSVGQMASRMQKETRKRVKKYSVQTQLAGIREAKEMVWK